MDVNNLNISRLFNVDDNTYIDLFNKLVDRSSTDTGIIKVTTRHKYKISNFIDMALNKN